MNRELIYRAAKPRSARRTGGMRLRDLDQPRRQEFMEPIEPANTHVLYRLIEAESSSDKLALWAKHVPAFKEVIG
ncbi:hypothetical protein [Lysobacter sp. FW306-1B-D06B]|uniref:hypothetical protein n=1 Tax=Lysobacter sp. FW306-1B-D06B TaxID=3140250 RepID=UPI003140B25D